MDAVASRRDRDRRGKAKQEQRTERGLESAARHDLTRREIDLEMPRPYQESQPHRHDVQHDTDPPDEVESSQLRRGYDGEGR